MSSGLGTGRIGAALLALLLAFAVLAPAQDEAKRDDPATAPADSPVADSLAVDSLAATDLRPLVPLDRRPRPRGDLLTALAWSAGRLWAVGDSGLAAWTLDDSSWTKIETPGPAALHCLAVAGDGRVVCGGDSGRVLALRPDGARPQRLDDERSVQAIAFRGDEGLLAGAAGLLAASEDGGRSWTKLESPLPMRFRCVLLEEGRWWAGGAGGYLFHSEDRGRSWTRLREPEGSALVALAPSGESGRPAALTLDGRVGLMGLDGTWRALGALEDAEGFSLAAWPPGRPAGWLAGGSGGRLLWLGADGGTLGPTLPEDSWSAVQALLARPDRLLLAGSWGLFGDFDPLGDGIPRRIEHDLFGGAAEVEALADDARPAAEELASDESPLDTVAVLTTGPRRLSNLLETDPRLSTPPTRLRQLLSSYNFARPTGVTGAVVLAVDVGARGEVEAVTVLDHWPDGLGFDLSGLDAAAQFSYTPAFADGAMVPSRVIQRLFFESDPRQGDAWIAGEGVLNAGIDTLLAKLPPPRIELEPKKLVRRMSFPREAKRYFWEGDVVLDYRLNAAGEILDAAVLHESVPDHGFGRHALEVLPDLDPAWPEGLEPAPDRSLRVLQRLRFDRKRYKRPAHEMEKGFRFVETLLSAVEIDSVEYEPGREQLVWLAARFFGEEAVRAWPELEANVELGADGRVHECQLSPVEPALVAMPELEALRGLALLFTWGRIRASSESDRATVRVRVDFSQASAAPEAMPTGYAALFDGVSY